MSSGLLFCPDLRLSVARECIKDTSQIDTFVLVLHVPQVYVAARGSQRVGYKMYRNALLRTIWVPVVVGSVVSALTGCCPLITDPAWLFRHPDEVIPIRGADRLHECDGPDLLSGRLPLGVVVTGKANQAELPSYEVMLDILAGYSKLPSKPTFHPENILVWFDGIPMTLQGKWEVANTCFKSFDIYAAYTCDSCLQQWCGLKDKDYPSNEITIDLSRYVEYEGEFVPVDPVVAVDNRNRPLNERQHE